MITLTRKKLNVLSRIFTGIWMIIIFTTKSFTWMTVAGTALLILIYVARYLYYKQLSGKNEKRKYLIGELTGIGFAVLALVIILVAIKVWNF